ncbi:hypothetical protein [Niallia sp. 03190]|uniref:hypothetical protein n=1 Tax=Niallia sp. 03190 TaxID=3458061 RepID=UPI004044444C
MEKIISPSNNSIDFGATGIKAILQTASFLLTTKKNTCPMDRGFGWDPPIDELSEIAKTQISSDIIELLELNIPELTVTEVNFEEDPLTGKLSPIVKVVINDG